MINSLDLLAAFSIGLLGSLHCIGMCGGISAALGQSLNTSNTLSSRINFQLLFSGGRIGSYMLAGLLVALAGEAFRNVFAGAGGLVLRSFAGIMMIALGLYVSGIWRGLTRLERLGGRLWARISPFTRKLLPVQTPAQALALGALWGWLPCGLVYSALSWSIAAPSPLMGALVMGYFGLGTLPAMLGVGLFSGVLQRFAQRGGVRIAAGFMLFAYGAWTLLSPWLAHGGLHGQHGG